jgi:hypothetical protein
LPAAVALANDTVVVAREEVPFADFASAMAISYYNAKMPEAFHVIPMLPPFGVTGKPVTDESI